MAKTWIKVARAHAILYGPLAAMYLLLGNIPSLMVGPMAFYIEHIVSNLNWILLATSLPNLFAAAIGHMSI